MLCVPLAAFALSDVKKMKESSGCLAAKGKILRTALVMKMELNAVASVFVEIHRDLEGEGSRNRKARCGDGNYMKDSETSEVESRDCAMTVTNIKRSM